MRATNPHSLLLLQPAQTTKSAMAAVAAPSMFPASSVFVKTIATGTVAAAAARVPSHCGNKIISATQSQDKRDQNSFVPIRRRDHLKAKCEFVKYFLKA